MEFRFSILGPTRVRIGDRFDDQWGHAKARGLLAVLLLHPRQSIPFDTLADWVWPPGEGPQQRGTFHKYGDRIRRALNQMRPRPALRCKDGAYRLDVDREEIDYFQFRMALARARETGEAGDHAGACRILEDAVRLWTDRPFADLQGEPAQRRRLRTDLDLWIPAYDGLLRELFALGRLDEMLRWLDDLPVDDHAHLALARHRLLALHSLGRRKEAIAYLHGARKRLQENDELDEADELLRLHNELREHDRGGLAVSVPGQRATLPAPQIVPRDIREFVGRRDQLDALDACTTAASGQPLSTVAVVDGPPGVGKTAVAIHWAHRVRHRYPGGVLFLDLNGYSDRAKRDSASVVDYCLAALDSDRDPSLNDHGKELRLSQVLSQRPVLIVLDNARDVDHIRDLVTVLTDCTVVITSRRRLRALASIVSARWVTVEPMNAAEAANLLSTQLGSHRVLSDEVKTNLVRQCGGLPIAITVLTGHLASNPGVPVAEFARNLTARQLVDDLGDGSATVGSLFAQSYRALAEPERRLFRLLSVHPGPDIGLDAACACDGRTPRETSRSLSALVGAHLVEQHAFARYRLHDLLVEFGAQQREADEPAHLCRAASRRLVRHYLESATRAASTSYLSYLAPPPLEDDLDVPSTSFADASGAHDWFYTEWANLTAVITSPTLCRPGELWRLVDPVVVFCDRYGWYTDSLTFRRLALTAAGADGNREGEISALLGLGLVQIKLGDHTSAQRHLDTALRLATEYGPERGRAAALHLLGRLTAMRGDSATALTLFRQSLGIADRTNDDEGRCWYLYRIGAAQRVTEQYDEALINLSDSRRLAQQIGEQSAEAAILTEIGTLHRERGEYDAAEAHLRRAKQVAEAMPDLTAIEQAYIALAELRHAQCHTDAALQHVQQAIEICKQTLNRADEAHALTVLGTIHHSSGNHDQARIAWRHAVHLYHRSENSEMATRILAKIDTTSPLPEPIVPAMRTEPQPDQQATPKPI